MNRVSLTSGSMFRARYLPHSRGLRGFTTSSILGNLDSSWLRDHCRCPKCIDPSSGQKLHSSADFWPPPVASRVDVSGNVLTVKWEDHKEEPSQYQLEELTAKANKDYPWDSDASLAAQRDAVSLVECPTIDYELLCQERGRAWSLRTLFGTGLVRVRGAPSKTEKDVPGVIAVAQRFGPVLETFYGVHWDVISEQGAQNLAYTSHPLDWHQDLLYMDSPPGIQILHCLSPAHVGGETLFLDGMAAAQRFQQQYPSEFALLSRIPLPYHYNNMGVSLCQYRSTFGPSPGPDCHRVVHWSPHWMGPILSVDPSLHQSLYQSLHTFAQFLGTLPSLALRLEAGDAVVFDNRRMLHARGPFSGGYRHLQGCYISRDTFRVELQDAKLQKYPYVATTRYK